MFTIATVAKLINYGLRPAGLALHKTSPTAAPGPSTVRDLPQFCFVDCRVLSNRSELLKALPRGGVVAEIGVADGDYSVEILSLNQPATLHLVDTWGSERFSDGFERVQSRFAREIAAGSVVVHRGRSVDILPGLAGKLLDWLYLDTTHAYADTAQELRLCESLVKDGGRIAGHDFCTGNPYSGVPYGVIQALYEFCLEHQWSFEYVSLDGNGYFSFCLKSRSKNLLGCGSK
jgi:Methyltransferase domain